MSNIKKGFLNAGSILAIVLGAILALAGLGCSYIGNLASDNLVVEVLKDDPNYTYYADDLLTPEEGDYYFVYREGSGEVARLSSKDINALVDLTKSVLTGIGIFIILLSVANIVLGALILKRTAKNGKCTGLTISLLVISIIVGNMITMAFMIVALCLKDKSNITIENNNQYGEQDIILN